MKIGTTFSYLEAEYLGVDWREAMEKTLNLRLNPIRIGAYWSEIEKRKGRYGFSLLDRQVEKVSREGREIILTVGVKSPRWPEFYFPSWLEERLELRCRETIGESKIGDYLFPFLEKTIGRYKDCGAVTHFQVENEPLNFSGPQQLRLGSEFLAREVGLVRRLAKKPIILNSWVETNPLGRRLRNLGWKEKSLETCLDFGDVLGLSVYPVCPGQSKIKNSNWKIFGDWLKKAKTAGKEAWVTEMQAEPWLKEGESKVFKDPLGNPSCKPEDIQLYFSRLRDLGFENILLWGAEFWTRCAQEGNGLWLKSVQELLG